MNIFEMQQRAWQNSENHGFHEGDNGDACVPTKLMLIVAETAEALEEHRAGKPLSYEGLGGKPEGIAAELADIIIRVGDLSAILGINLEAAVESKMIYNEGRPYKHGGKRY